VEAKFSKKASDDLQAEWQGYYNNVERTLLEKDPKVYYEDVAKAALIFSGITYDKNMTELKGCLPNFSIKTHLSTTIKSNTIRGFVGDYGGGKYIVAAFEGTDSNWQLLNEWAYLGDEPFNGNDSMNVVKYWNMIALDQVINVTSALSELIASYPTAPVIVTGHSLGAATATLVLAYLFAKGAVLLPMDRLFIYTFGQPRVGGSNFATWYNTVCGDRHFRVIHHNDMVPHIPCCEEYLTSTQCRSTGDKFDPWHIMTEIYYNSTNMTTWKYCMDEPLGEDTSCSYSVPVYDYSITNHLTYFDARVGYMCEILLGKYPSKFTNEHKEIKGALTGLLCVY
jgi:hypothetical protein